MAEQDKIEFQPGTIRKIDGFTIIDEVIEMAEQERCGTCRFWRRGADEEGYDSAFCHRNAPVLVQGMITKDEFGELAGSMFSWAVFPRTSDDDWCGEYQPREKQGE